MTDTLSAYSAAAIVDNIINLWVLPLCGPIVTAGY